MNSTWSSVVEKSKKRSRQQKRTNVNDLTFFILEIWNTFSSSTKPVLKPFQPFHYPTNERYRYQSPCYLSLSSIQQQQYPPNYLSLTRRLSFLLFATVNSLLFPIFSFRIHSFQCPNNWSSPLFRYQTNYSPIVLPPSRTSSQVRMRIYNLYIPNKQCLLKLYYILILYS